MYFLTCATHLVKRADHLESPQWSLLVRNPYPLSYMVVVSPCGPFARLQVTYVLEGGWHHKDSQGNEGHLHKGWVQWMTAGSGVIHTYVD